MAAAKKAPTPPRDLLKLIWRQPLYAVPFAIFFDLLAAGGWRGLRVAYASSLVIAYSVGLAIWATEWFIYPRLPGAGAPQTSAAYWLRAAAFPASAMVASFAGAYVLHLTILPSILGGPRSVMLFGLFALIFAVMFTGIAYIMAFYRQSIERAKAEQESSLARRIQRSFLLSSFPSRPRIEVHAVNVSSKQVSGDFYDVVPAGDDALLLAIADVAGKGIPAALLSSMLQASLRTQANTVESAAAILRNINGLVYRSTAVSQFATFFLARVDERAMRLTYSNAGHNPPVLLAADGRRLALDRGGVVVGIMEGADYEEGAVELAAGDRLVLYTDGISEAEDGMGRMFGEESVADLVAALPRNLTAREATERILAGVRGHLGGAEPGDDMTVMVVKVRE